MEKIPITLHDEEIKSEYLRSFLLVILFSAILLVSIANNYLFIEATTLKGYGNEDILLSIILFIAIFIAYQIINLFYLKWKARNITLWYKILHTLIEVTFTSSVIFYLLQQVNTIAVIDSPVIFAYTLFIVLSVLHLDYRINIFVGFLVAVQYAALTYYGFQRFKPSGEYTNILPANAHYIRSIILLFSGGAAAFVSIELKKRMSAAFNYLEQNRKLEFLFGQQVSKEVSQALMDEKNVIKKLEATVMFLDIRNFTSFADSHSAEEVSDYQNKFLSPVIDIINLHQGVVYQILGDGLMACFGSPVENVLHADMAFQASTHILDQVKQASEKGAIPPTTIGIGLHCGYLIAGNIGSELRKQFSISGTPVIVASRIEQLNKKYNSQLLLSGQVYNKITTGKVNITHLGQESLRGIATPVDIYRVDR